MSEPNDTPSRIPKRGGRRQGAGRPKGDSRMFAFRADGTLAQYIEAHDNKSRFVVDCIEAVRRREADGGVAFVWPRLGTVVPATMLGGLPLPLFDVRVVAGFPIPLDSDEAAQRIDLLKMLCPNPEATYLIRVEGESMRDADIHTGDILVVDKSNRQPTPRQVAMCELDGEYTVKYVEKTSEGFRLIPANTDYPAIEVGPGNRFSVWGVVTYVIHSPRH